MDDQRLFARPTLHEGDEPFDVLDLWGYVAFLGRADVVQPQPQMIFRRNCCRTRQVVLMRQQRNNVAGSGRPHGLMEPRQRTYVNHYTFLSRAPRSPRKVNPVADSTTRGDG